MNLNIQGKNVEITKEIKAYANEKFSQAVREVRGRGRIDDLNLLRDWFEKLPEVPPQKLPPAVFLGPATHR